MLKNIIVIENGKKYQFDTEQELIKEFICEDYYELTEKEKREKLQMKAVANSLNTKHDISENVENEIDLILSILIDNENLILLEKKESNIFTKELNKSRFTKNYIIVNKFAKDILEKRNEEKTI